MNFEITSIPLQFGLLAIAVLTGALIFFVKAYYRRKSESDLTAKNAGRKWRSPLEARTKYPEVDIFQLRGTFLNYGIAVALLLVIGAIGWTTFDRQFDVSQYLPNLSDEIQMEIPRTAEPPPPPPPVPAAIQAVPSDLPDVQSMIFKDLSVDESTAIDAPVPAPKRIIAPPPPPPPPVVEDEREIFKVVEDFPRFPGCEDIANKAERQKCADAKLLDFIYQNIQYPSIARENGVDGMVVVRFIVEKDGTVTNIEVIRDIGAGCGEEAKRIVEMMPAWIPGKQRERPVRVMFTLPVKFKLA